MQFQGIGVRAELITPNDDTVFGPTMGLYVGGAVAGDVVVVMYMGSDVITFEDVPPGTFMPISVKKVMVASTATQIIALFDS